MQLDYVNLFTVKIQAKIKLTQMGIHKYVYLNRRLDIKINKSKQ